jgi:hypothetical protein
MIGKKLWRHDSNCRHYDNDDGTRSSSPIYIKSFVEYFIVGETAKSWLISRIIYNEELSERQKKQCIKVPKTESFESNGYHTTWESVLDNVWVHDNIYKIHEKVRTVKEKNKLERILAIIEE